MRKNIFAALAVTVLVGLAGAAMAETDDRAPVGVSFDFASGSFGIGADVEGGLLNLAMQGHESHFTFVLIDGNNLTWAETVDIIDLCEVERTRLGGEESAVVGAAIGAYSYTFDGWAIILRVDGKPIIEVGSPLCLKYWD